MPMIKPLIKVAALVSSALAFSVSAEQTVNVYNWSDYIAEDTLANFKKKTGIDTQYDVFDSNEVLEAKLLSGKTGYDVVVPSASFLARQIKAGVFQPLDLNKIPNAKGLDQNLMNKLTAMDPGNKYGIPYLWGTTGIGINVKEVQKRLGKDVKLDSWDIIFKPENAAKLEECGITLLDAWDEMTPTVLNYLGEDPVSQDRKLLEKKVKPLLASIHPYVRYYHSSKYINDLANGDVCISVGWSGDVMQAQARAEEAKNGVEIAYIIPKEGAGLWFDMMAIPKDAKNLDNAYAFINYVLDPKVMGDIVNYVWYPSAIPASKKFTDKEIINNQSIYPSPDVAKKLFPFPVYNKQFDRVGSRMWTSIKSAKTANKK